MKLLCSPAGALLGALFLCIAACLPAKTSEWTDPQGKKFKGEPTESMGPFAVIRTKPDAGRRLLIRAMPPDELARFAQETLDRPVKAARWSDAKGKATRDLIGYSLQVRDKKLVEVDFTQVPEPDYILVFAASSWNGITWEAAGALSTIFTRYQRVRPGMLGGIFLGFQHTENDHKSIALTTNMPWYVAPYGAQRSMPIISRFVPTEGAHLFLLTRDGVPILGSELTDSKSLRNFTTAMTDLLSLTDEENILAWPDRLLLAQARRAAAGANATAPAELVLNPLRDALLRKHGARVIDATLEVSEEGAVTSVTWSESAQVPAKLKAPVDDAIKKRMVFIPAWENGKPVASRYSFRREIPAAPTYTDAERSWLNGDARQEIPFSPWLLLSPIKVREEDFAGSVEKVNEDGTVVISAMTVGSNKMTRKVQMTAFNSDFFGTEGPAAVAPKEGDAQEVDGTKLTWRRHQDDHGFVNFRPGQANVDYSIGYAYTEVESLKDQEAWLGIGSDDGLKIWLNGDLVVDSWVRRPSRIDDDIVPLRLKQGTNRILLKIQNVGGDWSFIARLRLR